MSQLKLVGKHHNNQILVKKFHRILQHKIESIVVTIEESKDPTLMSIEDMEGSSVSHERR